MATIILCDKCGKETSYSALDVRISKSLRTLEDIPRNIIICKNCEVSFRDNFKQFLLTNDIKISKDE